jgi:CRISPR-associated protein Cmr2
VTESALLTFSIGPVHAFIGQARRIADLWAGSQILSDLTHAAVDALLDDGTAALIFPRATRGNIPHGLPNRFVARVPLADANQTAERVESTVRKQWEEIVSHGSKQLGRLGFDVHELLATDPLWKEAIHCSWSWVAEEGGYAHASQAGAELYAASRVFRPFAQSDEWGMKCAICGERNALPNGDRVKVTKVWRDVEGYAAKHAGDLTPFVRPDQTRLCLVCASKRFYPTFVKARDLRTIFDSFEKFQPEDDRPYFALVTMDGDRLGESLRNASEEVQGKISEALSDFAGSLRTDKSADLNLATLGLPWPPPSEPPDQRRKRPQLIYAGGEDVLFVADPRDALDCTMAIREHYGRCFKAKGFEAKDHTISGAVVFAHTKIPAGRLLSDAEELLKRKAKAERDSIAIALHKRSGPAVETVFPWDGAINAGLLQNIVDELKARNLASRQTYELGEEHRALTEVFTNEQQWRTWLEWRLGRGEGSRAHVGRLAELLAPLFVDEKKRVEALRIARFLSSDVSSKQKGVSPLSDGGAA